MIDEASVRNWMTAYERAWRAPGTGQVAGLFTADGTYRMSPFAEPYRGRAAIEVLWDAERSGPDEEFEMEFRIVAIDHPRAVAQVDVRYGRPRPVHFRDLWILEFAADGRCRAFEEWPFTADRPVPQAAP